MIVVVALLLVFSGNTNAEQSTETLYKYVSNGDGSYGYGTTPVPFYSGSSETVEIPTSFEVKKTEFRGAWVATISNLNMPLTTSKEQYQTEYLKVLDTLEEYNMNAVIFQVRPLLDAFYPSELNPWSEFVTGTTAGQQGVDPGWDPLEWMIEQTHARGMEYHAWFNPYRVSNTAYSSASMLAKLGKTKAELDAMSNVELVNLYNEKGILSDDNMAVKHPDWVLQFKEKLFLNPGIPAVQQYVVDSIEEVVTNYDVDAIHFDDYFYPYQVSGEFFGTLGEDRATFETYGIANGYTDDTEGLENWRRDNVTALVAGVHEVITNENQANNKAIQFGISPFGIWEHKAVDSRGSNTPTSSSSSYSKQIYADTLGWIKEGIIDYVAPQIYWSFGQAAAPYGELARWWSNAVEGTDVQLYIGHANYKHVSNGGWDAEWMNPEEIINQLKFNQLYPNIDGSSMFSYNDLVPSNIDALPAADKAKHEVKNQSIELLKELYQQSKPLVPAKTKLSSEVPVEAQNVVRQEDERLTWDASTSSDERYYVVYKQAKEDFTSVEDMVSDAKNITKKIWTNDEKTFTHSEPQTRASSAQDYVYAVTAVSFSGNESAAVLFDYPEIAAPVVTSALTNESTSIEGTGVAGYEIQVTLPDGTTKTSNVESDQSFRVAIPKVAANKTVDVTMKNTYTQKTSSVTLTVANASTTDTDSDTKTTTVTASGTKPNTGMQDPMLLVTMLFVIAGGLLITSKAMKRKRAR